MFFHRHQIWKKEAKNLFKNSSNQISQYCIFSIHWWYMLTRKGAEALVGRVYLVKIKEKNVFFWAEKLKIE